MVEKELEINRLRRVIKFAARKLEHNLDCPSAGKYNPNVCPEIDDENVCVNCWFNYLMEQG